MALHSVRKISTTVTVLRASYTLSSTYGSSKAQQEPSSKDPEAVLPIDDEYSSNQSLQNSMLLAEPSNHSVDR